MSGRRRDLIQRYRSLARSLAHLSGLSLILYTSFGFLFRRISFFPSPVAVFLLSSFPETMGIRTVELRRGTTNEVVSDNTDGSLR